MTFSGSKMESLPFKFKGNASTLLCMGEVVRTKVVVVCTAQTCSYRYDESILAVQDLVPYYMLSEDPPHLYKTHV